MILYNIDMAIVTPISVKLEDTLWMEFKSTINRDKTLNQAVVELIQDHVDKVKNEVGH
jgi:hypothetical protein